MVDEIYKPAVPEDKPHAPPSDAETSAHTSRWLVVAWWLGFGIPFFGMVLAIAAWPHAALPIALGAAVVAIILFFVMSHLCPDPRRKC
jgi:fatty acid desaturase